LSENQINLEAIKELLDALATNSTLNLLNIRLNTLKNVNEEQLQILF
ncbi:12679_t:CDS:1, partial [Gigaspora rosea]